MLGSSDNQRSLGGDITQRTFCTLLHFFVPSFELQTRIVHLYTTWNLSPTHFEHTIMASTQLNQTLLVLALSNVHKPWSNQSNRSYQDSGTSFATEDPRPVDFSSVHYVFSWGGTKICNPSSSRGKICPDNIQRMNTNDHRVKDYFWSNDRFWLLFFVIPATWPPAPGHLKCKNYRQAGYPWKVLSKCSSAALKLPS